MIITEIMPPQVPDINDKTWERPDLSLRLKFSEIVLHKFTLALDDFVFTFLFILTFTLFLSVTRTLYGILKKKRNVILFLMFSSTYIPNMKPFPFFILEKKRPIGFQTKISVTHRFRCFTSCQPHPFYRGKIVRLQQRQLSIAIWWLLWRSVRPRSIRRRQE